jgi:hypothetical protein
MTIFMSKQAFLDLLQSNIPDQQARDNILTIANDLVVADILREDLAALISRRMSLVYGAYKRHNPKNRNCKPAVEQVMSWLLLSSGLPYITILEERLSDLHRILMEIGMIELDKPVTIKATAVLEMRVLSYMDPAVRPARLRKKRASLTEHV